MNTVVVLEDQWDLALVAGSRAETCLAAGFAWHAFALWIDVIVLGTHAGVVGR